MVKQIGAGMQTPKGQETLKKNLSFTAGVVLFIICPLFLYQICSVAIHKKKISTLVKTKKNKKNLSLLYGFHDVQGLWLWSAAVKRPLCFIAQLMYPP